MVATGIELVPVDLGMGTTMPKAVDGGGKDGGGDESVVGAKTELLPTAVAEVVVGTDSGRGRRWKRPVLDVSVCFAEIKWSRKERVVLVRHSRIAIRKERLCRAACRRRKEVSGQRGTGWPVNETLCLPTGGPAHPALQSAPGSRAVTTGPGLHSIAEIDKDRQGVVANHNGDTRSCGVGRPGWASCRPWAGDFDDRGSFSYDSYHSAYGVRKTAISPGHVGPEKKTLTADDGERKGLGVRRSRG